MKMKTFLITATMLVAAAAFMVPEGHAAAIVKIGVLDLQRALNATTEGMAAKETLKSKHSAKQEQIDAMKAELDTMEEKLKSPVLSQEAQNDLKEKVRAKKGEIIEFITEAKEAEEKENQQLSGRILEGLVTIAQDIAKAEGYTMILERSSGGVLYAQDTVDLTDRVVKQYNSKVQSGAKP